jgi:hypothetical protein
VSGWKITLLAIMAGVGAMFVAGGTRSLVEQASGKLWAAGGELGVGIGVILLVAAMLLFRRWRAP